MVQKLNAHRRDLLFRESFRWEGPVEDFVSSRIVGKSINVPCGLSKLGDVRIDSELGPTKKTIDELDSYREKFDTGISDPPWKIQPFLRPKWFFRVVDCVKPGGVIIYNATWIPKSKFVTLRETYIRQSFPFSNLSVISVFDKVPQVRT